MRIRLSLLGIVALTLTAPAPAADWPQFRGPGRDGISKETGLLKSWPKDGPKLAWTFKNAGLGFSSLSVVGGKVYTLGTRGDDEVVLCLDAAKGTELWVAKVAPIFTFVGNAWGDGPRGTPTLDGDRLYALGGQGELVCLDVSGAQPRELWRKSLVKDLGGEMMVSQDQSWGFSESPLVDGKLLVCTPGGSKGTLAALDKMTGAVVWRSTGMTQQAPYSSVMAADIQGVRQYIQASYVSDKVGGYLSGFAAQDGTVLWSHQIVKGQIYLIAANPLIQGDLVYSSSYKGCHLLEIGKGFSVKEKYSAANQKVMKNNHGGFVRVGDHIYGYSERGWACQEFLTGAEAWEETELAGQQSGATVSADGMLYLYTDNGDVGLAEANPKEFKLVSNFTIPEKSKYPKTRTTSRSSAVWSHPAIANGHLFLRDCELIFCYDIRGK
jgi:outer membrane protein assembly factor BamB